GVCGGPGNSPPNRYLGHAKRPRPTRGVRMGRGRGGRSGRRGRDQPRRGARPAMAWTGLAPTWSGPGLALVDAVAGLEVQAGTVQDRLGVARRLRGALEDQLLGGLETDGGVEVLGHRQVGVVAFVL